MNNNQAISWFETKLTVNKAMGFQGEQNETAILAIQALKRENGLSPLEIKDKRDFDGNIIWQEGLCPICNSILTSDIKYCCKCGQKLDWSEGNENDGC